jgi:ABC-2 type transport system permease protein
LNSGKRVVARPAGFWRDLVSLGERAVRSIPRDPETLVGALIVPAFFFLINVGALQDLTEGFPGAEGFDYKAFQIPVAILFAVTGLSRANILVLDIQGGYFDRLAVTPVNRPAMMLGFMVADMALAVVMTIPVLILALAVGVEFKTGVPGVIALLVMTVCWTAIYNGFPYAIALKTGNPAAVNTSFIIFFPVVFLSPVFVPQEAMTGWMATIVTFNPVTYLLGGMRSLVSEGWVISDILGAIAGIAAIGSITFPLATWALLGRLRRK